MRLAAAYSGNGLRLLSCPVTEVRALLDWRGQKAGSVAGFKGGTTPALAGAAPLRTHGPQAHWASRDAPPRSLRRCPNDAAPDSCVERSAGLFRTFPLLLATSCRWDVPTAAGSG